MFATLQTYSGDLTPLIIAYHVINIAGISLVYISWIKEVISPVVALPVLTNKIQGSVNVIVLHLHSHIYSVGNQWRGVHSCICRRFGVHVLKLYVCFTYELHSLPNQETRDATRNGSDKIRVG